MLEGKIHDHNSPCCLKILIWNKPLFCSLNFLWSVVWNPWVDLAWMSKPWIMEWWMLKSWIMEWMLQEEEAKKKILLKSLGWQGLRMLEEQRWELCRKILLHPLRGIEHPCSILCVAQVLPPEYSVKAVEIKAWLLLRKRMTHNVTFFFFFCGKKGWIQCFPFSLHPTATLRCAARQAGEQIMNLPKCGYWYSWDHYTWGSCELSHRKGHFSEGCGHDINGLTPSETSAGRVLSPGTFFKMHYQKGKSGQLHFYFFLSARRSKMVHLPLTINVMLCKELWPDPQLLKVREICFHLHQGASVEFPVPG